MHSQHRQPQKQQRFWNRQRHLFAELTQSPLHFLAFSSLSQTTALDQYPEQPQTRSHPREISQHPSASQLIKEPPERCIWCQYPL